MKSRVAAATMCLVALVGCGDSGSTPTAAAPPRVRPPTRPPAASPSPPPSPPEIPARLRVSATGTNFIEWSWDAVPDVSGYDVELSRDETFADPFRWESLNADQRSYRLEVVYQWERVYLPRDDTFL